MLFPGWLLILRAIALALAADITTVFLGARKHAWPLLGFCYGFQIVDALEAMSWDCKMDCILAKTAVMR